MPVKLLALDMDGTLLNRARKITPRIKTALDEAIKLGVIIVPATGRSHKTAFKPLDMFGHDFPVISSNGALVRDQKNTYFEAHISTDTVSHGLEIAQDVGVSYFIYEANMIYASPRNLHTGVIDRWHEVSLDCFTLAESDAHLMQIAKGTNIIKLLVVEDDPEKFAVVKRRFRDEIPELYSVNSEKANLDITPVGVHKGSSLVALAKKLNIDISEVMAVGDGENDLEMIELAGIGVAMGNAIDMVKSVANFVTLDNEHDGVAIAVEKFIL